MRLLQKILPPFYLLAALVLMGVLHVTLPLLQLIRPPYTLAGIALLVAGLCLLLLGSGAFRRAGTPVRPFEPATALVVEGLFGLSRNPMYTGMVLMLLGTAILLGSLAPFFIIPVFIVIIQEGYIRHEERFLEQHFGQAYREDKERVRRWL